MIGRVRYDPHGNCRSCGLPGSGFVTQGVCHCLDDEPIVTLVKPIRVPPGWRILERRDCTCGREAFILCEKSDQRPDDTRYVTWEADLVHGGCYHGHYTEDLDEAKADLANRYTRHEGRL